MIEIERMRDTAEGADAVAGKVCWAPVQSLWTLGMAGAGLVGGAMTVSLERRCGVSGVHRDHHRPWPLHRHAPRLDPSQL
ncbi:hypothetical protein NHF40_13285 [Maricaulaceae bacterium EIL42A08]|nr:hypothetical protein [Maricaulaceae bacterium EIL42A08]